MKPLHFLNQGLKAAAVVLIVAANLAAQAVTWPNTPLGATISAIPMTMLVAGKDHKFFYEAYNDASDVDGDGTLDTRFKPSIVYYGLYDSTLCYAYDSSDSRFEPAATAGVLGTCPSSTAPWSGNWLNYMTTSRIDALRKVLYGGHREIDSTTETVLRRAYIPQDAHSWGKEYHSETTDGYRISDYTPFSQPADTNRRHFFGNLTPNQGINCSTLNDCSDINPVLRVRTDVGDNRRIWEWASKERPVLLNRLAPNDSFPTGTGAQQDYVVRVQVCTSVYQNGCKQYPNGGSPIYKPVGLLHEYGENNSMLFGLLTGSYDKHMSGGRLRKVVSSFADEVNSSTGRFNSAAPIVNTFNRLRIRGYNQSSNSNEYWKSNPYTDSAKAPTEGELVDWGNPIGEMLYEATRYFAGKGSPTSAFHTGTTHDNAVGLSRATWDDPYSSTSAAKAAYCSRASFLAISDVNTSFDSDSVPGSYFSSFSGDLTGLNVTTRGDTITGVESNITGLRFIGQSEALYDAAPTAKTVNSLATIRGLAPDEPGKQGSYYAASLAYHAKTSDLRATGSTALQGTQTVDTYVVALTSPLPKIEARLPNGRVISVVPFAKTVSGSGVSSTKGNYQPTNQIVDFYIEKIANSGAADADSSVNGGRYYAEFQINFEDVEQGGDHDMDAIARYVVQANANNTLSVNVIPTYQAGGMQQHMGYVISGTNRDGVYLVARDETTSPAYFLNVPPGRSAGHCDMTPMPADCANLPSINGTTTNVFDFTPGTGTGARLLKDPLWYAAKYGGFVDRNGSKTPDLPVEWDNDDDGVPDTYFLVQNPLKLRDALKRAFDGIIEKSGSGGNIIANSTVLSTNSLVYQATFNSRRWSGDLEAYPATDSGVGANTTWRASEQIPAAGARNIFYWSDSVTTTSSPTVSTTYGKSFLWGNLSTAEQALLNNDSNILDYIRGVRSKELQNGGTLRDRATDTVLGDIAHSSPFFSKDSETVFIGANDGMLHAFDSKTGKELFAFIPSAALPKLKKLTEITFNENHQYFVDGDSAISSNAQTPGKNYMVSTLGRGGKGLFGLDVTDPGNFTAANVLWEYASATDADLGYMLGRPVIARMKNDTWAVIVGNGYNSVDGKAVLYIFDLATGALIRKIDTGVAGDNGLATPGVRLDTDGKASAIYAGDLKGNVWKFDVSGSTTATWTVSNSGLPFFKAVDGSGTAQPITAPITMARNDVSADPNYNKFFVYFGTGSDFQVSDPSNTQTQTWYGLIDEDVPVTGRSVLKARTITETGTLSGKPVRVFEEAVLNDMVGMKGFYIDLPETGERIVSASNYYKLAEPVLLASSVIPVLDVCIPGGNGYLNAINPFTGARLTKPFFDVTDNGSFSDDVLNGANIGSVDLGVGKPGEAILIGNRLAVGGSKGVIKDIRINLGITAFKGRLSWREIIRD